tara:strand:- start:6508 stop:6960 length:453 start_codon:yes stop_codon:yes gene_type:complete
MQLTGSNYYHFIYTGSGKDLVLPSESVIGDIIIWGCDIYQTEVTNWVNRHNATPVSASQATDIWNTNYSSSDLPSDYSNIIKYYYVREISGSGAEIEHSDQEYLSGSQPIEEWTTTLYRTKNQPWVTRVGGIELSQSQAQTLWNASSSAS